MLSLICTRRFGKNSLFYVGKMKESIFPAATHLTSPPPPLPPPLNQGRGNGASWLLRGFIFDLEGWASAVPFYILSKITILDKTDEKFVPSPLPSKIEDEKMGRFGFCAASSLICGDGSLLFHFILSKIVATSNSKLVTSKSQLAKYLDFEKSLSSDSVRSTYSKSTKYPVQTIIIDVLAKNGTSF